MRTVNSYLLELAHIVDPTDINGDEFTDLTICTERGSRFTAQRLLDIYNEARLLLVNVLRTNYPKAIWNNVLQAMIVEKNDLTFSSGVAALPDDCLEIITLENSEGDDISVLPYNNYSIVKNLESANNLLVIKYANNLVAPNGNTYLPNANTYILRYLAYSRWEITDVTGGTETELISDDYGSKLIRIATLIANEKARLEIDQLVKQLLGVINAAI